MMHDAPYSPLDRPERIAEVWIEAWMRRDAEKLASLFIEDAEFVNVAGLWWHDRASIQKAHAYGLARIFNESTLALQRITVKMLSADIAVVHARMRLEGQTPVAGIASPGVRHNVFSFVVRRTDEGWRCVSAHNTDVVPGMETNIIDEEGRFRSVDYRAEDGSLPGSRIKSGMTSPRSRIKSGMTTTGSRDDHHMRVRFWGVRGSIPAPGPSTARYGGNTSCVSIEFADGRVLVLDAGTGLRLLGDELAESGAEISMALTHAHWDHIQGFPFFAPLYQAGRTILFAPHARARSLFELLIQQMDGTKFPVARDTLPSSVTFLSDADFATRTREIAKVTRLSVNHPGDTDGIRIDCGGRAVVYIPDNELDPPYQPIARFDEIVAFCQDADVLIHDSQYLKDDMPAKRGWGHSVVDRVCDLAAEADVAHLVLFHHDPYRTDDQLDVVQEDARKRLSQLGSPAVCTAAYEGLTLTV